VSISDRKQALRDELVQQLEADLENAERAYKAAIEGATHAEAKPENDKDTRGLEQSYVARGQAQRVEQLGTAVAELRMMPLRAFAADDPVALGALFVVEEDERQSELFMALPGGGAKLSNDAVQVVTPKSPLGVSLIGKRAGDDCEAVIGGRRREIAIIRVR
jgi:transcription elongation GreA/GreB family factor